MDIKDIDVTTLVPHKPPMLLLDRLTHVADEKIESEVHITKDSQFYNESLQGVGSWIGIEYMAQTMAAYSGWQAYKKNEKFGMGFLLGVRKYITHQHSFPLDAKLSVTAELQYLADGVGSFVCKILDSNGQIISKAMLMGLQPSEQQLKELL